jgi:hypothetical protein
VETNLRVIAGTRVETKVTVGVTVRPEKRQKEVELTQESEWT